MKKIFLYIIIPLLILVAITVLFINLFSSSKQPEEASVSPSSNPFETLDKADREISNDTPLDTTLNCFTWYVKGFIAGGGFINASEKPQTAMCFTQEYISNFQKIAKESGADPILMVQGEGESWDSPLKTKILSSTSDTSEVEVILGTNEGAMHYKVTLSKKAPDVWLISSIKVIQ